MERKEQISYLVKVFGFLMRETINPHFAFPGGGIVSKTMDSCMGSLEKACSSGLSHERLLDYCICQIFAISSYSELYINRWNISHSFGKKAIQRFGRNTKIQRYYEDKWLDQYGFSRSLLLERFSDRRDHPYRKFIYPEYEERTKLRLLNTEAGFYICQLSTLLWTPFSKACQKCNYAGRCKGITSRKYDELYRIREEEYQKTNRK